MTSAPRPSAPPSPSRRVRRGGGGRRGRVALTAVPVLTALLLSGCQEDEVHMAAAGPEVGPSTAVTVAQAKEISTRVQDALAAGNEAQKVSAFGPRVTGPYRELAAARMAVEKRKKVDGPAVSSLGDVRHLVPIQPRWPRFFVLAGRSSSSVTPVLRVLRSEEPRDPYALWAELTFVPGATLPSVAGPARGAEALPPDASGLVMTPAQAVSRYAQVLEKGTAAKHAKSFARDELREQLAQRLAEDRKALKGIAGDYTDTHAVDEDSVLALRTADGGALVVGLLREKYVITVRSGAGKITPRGDLARLAKRSSFTKKLTRTSLEVVALAVPRAGGGNVRLIAAQKGDVALTGS